MSRSFNGNEYLDPDQEGRFRQLPPRRYSVIILIIVILVILALIFQFIKLG